MVRAPGGFVCLHHALGTSPLNPCGISQLQPSVLGVRWSRKKQATLLSFITTACSCHSLKSQRTVGSGWPPYHCIWCSLTKPPQGRTSTLFTEEDGRGYYYYTHLMICKLDVKSVDSTDILVFTLVDLELLYVGTRKQVWASVRKWILFFSFFFPSLNMPCPWHMEICRPGIEPVP